MGGEEGRFMSWVSARRQEGELNFTKRSRGEGRESEKEQRRAARGLGKAMFGFFLTRCSEEGDSFW